ncbi:MAG: cobalt ECF transporter T component CbiQ, partial [Candidatus Hydrogenedentes bacterium]|nr:cobalt ECF transporter T component CbiQ [Candidatus Hydrogenedentota bacterium]
MFAEAFVSGDSWVHRLDPRGRVLAAVALSLCVALLTRVPAAAVACAGAVALAVAARLPLRALVRRLLPLNGFLALLCGALLLSSGGGALLIALKANALLLILTALLTTMEFTQLGRALHALRVPSQLTTLLLLTGRYIAVLQYEYGQLRRAMRVRAFTPRTDMHTMRMLGYLVGMLLVRGLERSERVLQAMK